MLALRAHHIGSQPVVLSATGERLGNLVVPLNPTRRGLIRATTAAKAARVDLRYLGPDDLWIT
ncbi:hypothetical protein [Sphingomonas qomolangmaensis]|uniref:Uncharacterized protein n=1 Tax=Sphingomonas qomolangmaensis TaxID=2918765 RepID=A0ABY5L9R6_9SPHN|nr:hypothetical protein [Sphingomonas qomolangmaensis]UUL82515.1 hypothetical protein NMP03_15310 [Sphingomonas qomolangmaensis]